MHKKVSAYLTNARSVSVSSVHSSLIAVGLLLALLPIGGCDGCARSGASSLAADEIVSRDRLVGEVLDCELEPSKSCLRKLAPTEAKMEAYLDAIGADEAYRADRMEFLGPFPSDEHLDDWLRDIHETSESDSVTSFLNMLRDNPGDWRFDTTLPPCLWDSVKLTAEGQELALEFIPVVYPGGFFALINAAEGKNANSSFVHHDWLTSRSAEDCATQRDNELHAAALRARGTGSMGSALVSNEAAFQARWGQALVFPPVTVVQGREMPEAFRTVGFAPRGRFDRDWFCVGLGSQSLDSIDSALDALAICPPATAKPSRRKPGADELVTVISLHAATPRDHFVYLNRRDQEIQEELFTIEETPLWTSVLSHLEDDGIEPLWFGVAASVVEPDIQLLHVEETARQTDDESGLDAVRVRVRLMGRAQTKNPVSGALQPFSYNLTLRGVVVGTDQKGYRVQLLAVDS